MQKKKDLICVTAAAVAVYTCSHVPGQSAVAPQVNTVVRQKRPVTFYDSEPLFFGKKKKNCNESVEMTTTRSDCTLPKYRCVSKKWDGRKDGTSISMLLCEQTQYQSAVCKRSGMLYIMQAITCYKRERLRRLLPWQITGRLLVGRVGVGFNYIPLSAAAVGST